MGAVTTGLDLGRLRLLLDGTAHSQRRGLPGLQLMLTFCPQFCSNLLSSSRVIFSCISAERRQLCEQIRDNYPSTQDN